MLFSEVKNMKQKLSQLPAPAIAGVVREKNLRSAIAQIKNCKYNGAEMIDLHMSCLEDSSAETLRKIVNSTTLPILALNYNNTHTWQDAGLSEEDRVDSFYRALEAGVAGIDIQGYTFHRPSQNGFCGEDKYSFTKGNPKEVVTDEAVIAQQCALIEKAHSMGAEVLLSCHPGIVMKTEQVVELALFLEKRNPDIIKIVTRAETEEDLAESIRTMLMLKKELKTPVSYHANGKAGALSRIVNPLLGAQIAFCVEHYDEGSTMEQMDLRTAAAVIENVRKLL